MHLQVNGVPEFANRAFSLLLDVYDMDCEKFGDTNRDFYSTVFLKIMKLPWEAKAKYHLLCALVPYLGTDKVRFMTYSPHRGLVSFAFTDFCFSGFF